MAKPRRKNSSMNKMATMLQATAMPKEELTSIAALGETADVSETMATEAEIEQVHKDLESESRALSLEVAPIYESTAIEINKKLSDELEECKTRYAELLEENDVLQKKIEELQKEQNSSEENAKLSVAYDALSKDYGVLQDKFESLQERYARDMEICKIQLDDAEKNYAMYDENESNYKIEIKKLRAEIKNLELALESHPNAKNQLAKNMQNPNIQSDSRQPMRNQNQQIPLPQFKRRVPSPTNGYSSWN